MQDDGNLVGYSSTGVFFATHTSNQEGLNKAVLQTDGNFVVYSGNGVALWATHTAGSSADRLVLQNDQNIVLLSGGAVLWASGTDKKRSVLKPGEELLVG